MKKNKKHTFIDEDYTDYIFMCEENGQISAFRKVNPFVMGNRDILHFILKKDKKRHTISEGRILAAIKQQRPINDIRYIPNHTTHSQRKKIALLEIIKAKQQICAEYPQLYYSALWDDAIISLLNSRDLLADTDIRTLLFKHLRRVQRQHQRHTQFEQLEYKIPI